MFPSTLLVLVNDFPTQEINIQKGLKQREDLALFLFLILVEGLSVSIRKAEKLGEYSRFKVGANGLCVPSSKC